MSHVGKVYWCYAALIKIGSSGYRLAVPPVCFGRKQLRGHSKANPRFPRLRKLLVAPQNRPDSASENDLMLTQLSLSPLRKTPANTPDRTMILVATWHASLASNGLAPRQLIKHLERLPIAYRFKPSRFKDLPAIKVKAPAQRVNGERH
jgi:hypothetical protein